MAPEVERGDLVVVTSTDRFPWGGLVGAAESGAPTTFGSAGDVIVFDPPDDGQRPILHRIAFPVTDGEDWTDRADPALLDGDCSTIAACPARTTGTSPTATQTAASTIRAPGSRPSSARWITAKALFSVPNLGWFRIGVDAAIARLGVLPTAVGFGGLAAVTGGFGAVLLGRITARRDRSDHGERGGRNR